jgi:hypothetical protein
MYDADRHPSIRTCTSGTVDQLTRQGRRRVAYGRTTLADPPALEGVEGPFAGLSGAFGGAGVEANPLDEAGNFLVTSEVLPPDQFPQFTSSRALTYGAGGGGPGPYDPIDGQFYVGALHADNSFMRLQRTIDVPAEAGQLAFSLSHNVEQAFDHVIVEAETIVGGQPQGDRTTLPDLNGGTSTSPSAACDQYPDGLHTSLLVYAGIGCESTEDTVLFGFGLEHIEDPQVRATALERVLDHLN